MVTLQAVRQARMGLPPQIRATPVWPAAEGLGPDGLWFQCENLQVTGSYKVRAAFHALQSLSPAQRAPGVALSSSGNFAQAFAYAAHCLGVAATVVMMEQTRPGKLAGARRWGARIELCENRFEARMERLHRLGREEGMVVIDHLEDLTVLVGHATVGWDLVQAKPDVDQVIVPCSTGGLLAAVAAVVKQLRPQARVIGVQPALADAGVRSFRAGRLVSIDQARTECDALTATRLGGLPFRLIQSFVDDLVAVEDAVTTATVVELARRAHLVVEPGAAVGLAALRAGLIEFRPNTVVLLSGGNLDLERLAAWGAQ